MPQGYFHSPTIGHRMVARDLEKRILPEEMVPHHYIDDIMLTCVDLLSLSEAVTLLQAYLKA